MAPVFSKAVKTVRVSNLDAQVQWDTLMTLFTSRGHTPKSQGSLCKTPDGTQVATVSFRSDSEASKALSLNGELIRGKLVEIDRNFFGLTILSAPEKPSLE